MYTISRVVTHPPWIHIRTLMTHTKRFQVPQPKRQWPSIQILPFNQLQNTQSKHTILSTTISLRNACSCYSFWRAGLAARALCPPSKVFPRYYEPHSSIFHTSTHKSHFSSSFLEYADMFLCKQFNNFKLINHGMCSSFLKMYMTIHQGTLNFAHSKIISKIVFKDYLPALWYSGILLCMAWSVNIVLASCSGKKELPTHKSHAPNTLSPPTYFLNSVQTWNIGFFSSSFLARDLICA